MGAYFSSSSITPVERFDIPVPKHGTILINQASCTQCETIVRDQGTCKCGNVQIEGGTEVLSRTIRVKSKYSDCSLIEFRGTLEENTNSS